MPILSLTSSVSTNSKDAAVRRYTQAIYKGEDMFDACALKAEVVTHAVDIVDIVQIHAGTLDMDKARHPLLQFAVQDTIEIESGYVEGRRIKKGWATLSSSCGLC